MDSYSEDLYFDVSKNNWITIDLRVQIFKKNYFGRLLFTLEF